MSIGAPKSVRKCILSVLAVLLFGAASVHAESHINLICSHARMVKKTTLENGRVLTENKELAATFPIDVDLEHKTINGVYDAPGGQRLEDASISIGGFASKFASEHDAGYQDTISIDRLSGRTSVTHLYLPAGDCATRSEKAADCRMSVTTTVYRCLPAVADFPTPIPRMMRAWERLHHYLRLARIKQVMRHWYHAVKEQIWSGAGEE
jgi:hypothetical protein